MEYSRQVEIRTATFSPLTFSMATVMDFALVLNFRIVAPTGYRSVYPTRGIRLRDGCSVPSKLSFHLKAAGVLA
jgi:hypothetical protein